MFFPGFEQGYKHELDGYLAGLWYLPGRTENVEVLACLHQCAESLQIPAASNLEPGMEMVANKQGSVVLVDGPSQEGLTKLVRQVAYLNTREFPSPGLRLLTVKTRVSCKDGEKKEITIEDHKSAVRVEAIDEPKIEITGTNELARDYEDFKLGVRIFADLHIVMTTGPVGNGNSSTKQMSFCSLAVTSRSAYFR